MKQKEPGLSRIDDDGCAIATAERFIRREMLGDTSDASPNEVKS